MLIISLMIHPAADIGEQVSIGEGTTIWHLTQVRERANIGRNCNLGRGVYVGPGVVIGDNCKIQNFALIYEPAQIDTGAFIGPGAILTNDLQPRAVTVEGRPKGPSDWKSVGVHVGVGASIGARVVCVAPVRVGRWALIGAGSVVVKDVPDHALVVGNPGRQIGWSCRCGRRLIPTEDIFVCTNCHSQYSRTDEGLSIYND
jgi:UDP-2-acetamido-3-amino-2,3-dideoxy-glucuronate N-acetyltransferase